MLRFSISRAGGLGDALPAGRCGSISAMRAAIRNSSANIAIGHTPMGSSLGLATGEAFDVKVRRWSRSATRVNDEPLADADALRR